MLSALVERADGTAGSPVELELPSASSVAAMVEVEPEPRAAARMRLRFETDAASLELYDLFVIATG